MLCLIPTALFFSYAFFISEVLLAQQITHQYPSNELIVVMSSAPIGAVVGCFIVYILAYTLGSKNSGDGWSGLVWWYYIFAGGLIGLIATPVLVICCLAILR